MLGVPHRCTSDQGNPLKPGAVPNADLSCYNLAAPNEPLSQNTSTSYFNSWAVGVQSTYLMVDIGYRGRRGNTERTILEMLRVGPTFTLPLGNLADVTLQVGGERMRLRHENVDFQKLGAKLDLYTGTTGSAEALREMAVFASIAGEYRFWNPDHKQALLPWDSPSWVGITLFTQTDGVLLNRAIAVKQLDFRDKHDKNIFKRSDGTEVDFSGPANKSLDDPDYQTFFAHGGIKAFFPLGEHLQLELKPAFLYFQGNAYLHPNDSGKVLLKRTKQSDQFNGSSGHFDSQGEYITVGATVSKDPFSFDIAGMPLYLPWGVLPRNTIKLLLLTAGIRAHF